MAPTRPGGPGARGTVHRDCIPGQQKNSLCSVPPFGVATGVRYPALVFPKRGHVDPTGRSDAVESKQLTPVQIRFLHAEMYRAGNDDLLAAYRREHQHPLVLSEGVLKKSAGLFSLYEFHLLEPALHLRPGQEVQGVFGSVHLDCTIVENDGLALCLALRRHLGARIDAGGAILTNTAFIMEALLRRLTAGIRASTHGEPCYPPFNGSMALRIIGAGTFDPHERLPYLDVFRRGPSLNRAQRRAVLLAFGSNACFLVGPPGTGKTMTLARVVEAHVLAGRSVLLLGPTNRAVDLLMRAVARRLRPYPAYAKGQVLRFGARPDHRLLGAHAAHVCLAPVADRIRLTRYAPAIKRLELLRMACIAEERTLGDLLGRSAGIHGPTPGSLLNGSLRRRLARVMRRRSRIDGQRRMLEQASDLLPSRLLERCEVLGTTIHQTYLSPAIRRPYDVVIIDEASMVSTVQAYVAAGLAKEGRGRVIVAGDYRQLPPIVLAKTNRAVEWLRKDVFHAARIPDALAARVEPEYVSVLNVQHRMSPGICGLVSRLFYNDRLTTDETVRNRMALPSPLGLTDAYWIDSTPAKPTVRRTGSSSRVNEVHLQLVEDLLAELDSGGSIQGAGPLKVAVISPFRGQAQALEKRLGTRYQGKGVEVTTSHRGQGNEAEIVILDLTDAPGLPISGFLGAHHHRDDGARLLTVAMSRARQQLYVLGAMDYLERAGGRVARALIKDLQQNVQPVMLAHFAGSAAKVYAQPSRVAKPVGGRRLPCRRRACPPTLSPSSARTGGAPSAAQRNRH